MLRTAIMEGFKCKQLRENSKHVVKKNSDEFSKYFDKLDPPAEEDIAKNQNLLMILIFMLSKTRILLTTLIAFPQLHTVTWILVQALSRQKT